ncbi:MAG: acyl-CoA-binding protein, partial [Chloroflexales bacterium]
MVVATSPAGGAEAPGALTGRGLADDVATALGPCPLRLREWGGDATIRDALYRPTAAQRRTMEQGVNPMSDLTARFEQAAQAVQALPKRPENDVLLKLYALYKQG